MVANKKQIIVPNSYVGQRADSVIHELIPEYSRARIQSWIKKGFIKIDLQNFIPKRKIIGGEIVDIDIQPEEQANQFESEDIPLNIVYDDKDIIVINKPTNLVVHPAAGNWSGTLLNAILYHYPKNSELPRAGIVHRLDKNTTGLMVIAKNEIAQFNLINQLQTKSVYREYRAIVWGQVMVNSGEINKPIGRHPHNRTKMAVNSLNGKDAITHYQVLERFGIHTYLKCILKTGRTHQIRVHMQDNKSPIVGDPTYGLKKIIPTKSMTENFKNKTLKFERQALHAKILGLIHPITKKPLKWEVDLPNDMKNLLELIREESEQGLFEEGFKISKDFYVSGDKIHDYNDGLEFDE
ncbi:23S rRNA pseudouridine(1911/1915/1917) synthase RluD [Methylophilaceae bacterium]|nr:23S rRNA pseudouridine(1911/1915/1917) synthase RluD [Methylophilaceae bacterium]|tara:strand:+ start:2376 stop:3431 length:1056 start_codon:yes stop_codon:yes gene_type:complete